MFQGQTTEIIQPDLYSGVLMIQTDSGQGSCFVVAQKDDYWYAITAAHVVDVLYPEFDDGPPVTVDDEEYEIEVVQIDSDEDVALIRFKSSEKYRIYSFSKAAVGESGTTVGWSDGDRLVYKGNVITVDLNGFIAVNGGVVPGCSGGPVLSKDGSVMGITVRLAMYRGQIFDSTILYVPARYAVALMIGSGIKEF
jgi:S1-C subfamily serine protease